MIRKYSKVSGAINYIEQLLILVPAITRCASVSPLLYLVVFSQALQVLQYKHKKASKNIATKNQVEAALHIVEKNLETQFSNDSLQNNALYKPVVKYFKIFTGNIDHFFMKI